MHAVIGWTFAAFLCLTSGIASAEGFAEAADTLLSSSPLRGATIGVVFLSLDDGATAYARNAALPLIPASLGKLAGSAAALEMLGPGFHFKTSFLMKSKEKGRSKLSALVWRGDGDPSISGRGRSGKYEIFEIWGATLAAKGIRRIGRLVLDDRAFERPSTIGSWPQDELSYWYAAQTSAISYNDNCVDLRFYPGPKIGKRAKIELDPDFGYLRVVNRTTTGVGGSLFTLDYRRALQSNRVEFFGAISSDSVRSDHVAVHEPALFAAHTLKRIWDRKGPRLGKTVFWERSGLLEELLEEIFSWESQPLSQLLKVINTNSQSLYAEQLLKALGRRVEGRGSFEGGLSAVRRFLAKAGLDGSEHQLVDGSGLSEDNRLSALAVVKILRYMKNSPLFTIYFESLATPGVDRAARDRMKGEPLARQMRLKRGTVKHARNLAGYLRTRSERLYAFAVLVNGESLDRPAVDAATDELCLAAVRLLP
ncbi:MAG: D-alanyl-D-alanine carboxypeptidase/D-alanyl-D-alanine-endopeptidase [Elusimicrobia bacterium]|nr:D-alanyl-D-alanine carboxypeptidase/D-alanyl-D-alanine-endopeptidase [Elusimicrobiota bacterium]